MFTSDEADMENLNDIEKVFTSIGIAIRDSSSEMRDVDEVLDELASKWETLNDVEKNAVATAAAGTRQRENFLVLMNNYNNALDLEADSLNSAGTATKKYEAYNDSLEASLNRLQSTFEDIVLSTGEGGYIKGFVDFANAALEVVDALNLVEGAFGSLVGFGISKVISGLVTVSNNMQANKINTEMTANAYNQLNSAIGQSGFSFEQYAGYMSMMTAKQKESIINSMLQNNQFKGLTATEIQLKLATLGLSQEEAKRAAVAITSYQATETETTATNKNTGAVVKNTVAKGAGATAAGASAAATGVDAGAKVADTAATGGLTAAQLGLNAAVNAFPFTWIFTAIGALIGIITQFAGASTTAADAYSEINQQYTESSQNLENYNSQLGNAKEELEQLNQKRKDGIELSDDQKDRILDLEDEIELLDSKIEKEENINKILKERNDIKKGDAEKEAFKNVITEGTIFDMAGKASLWGMNLENIDKNIEKAREYYSDVEGFEQNLKNLILERDKASEEGDFKKWSSLNQQITELQTLKSEAQNIVTDLSAVRDALEESAPDSEYIDVIDSWLNKISSANDEIWETSELLSTISDSDNVVKESLEGLTRSYAEYGHDLGLIENHMNKYPEFAEFVDELTRKLGSKGAALAAINEYLSEQADEWEEVEDSADDSADAIEDYYEAYSELESIEDILSTYSEDIVSAKDQLEILAEAQEQVAETGGMEIDTFNALMSNGLYGYLGSLYDGSFNLADAQEQLALSMQNAAIAAIYEAGQQQILDIVNGSSAGTASAAAGSFATLGGTLLTAGSNAAVSGQDAAAAAEGWAKLMAAIQAGEGKFAGLTDQQKADIAAVQKNVENAVKGAQNMYANLGSVGRSSGGGGGGSRGGGGGGGGGSSSSKKEEDTWKKAFEDEYDTLKHYREMDLITEEEYLNKLDDLNKKYFAGRSEYLEDFRKHEEEVYKGRKDMLEDQMDEAIEAAEKEKDAQEESIESQIDALEDLKDAYEEIIDKRKENLKSMKDEKEYQDELNEKNSDILDLQNRIEELRYDTSAEGTKKRLELEDELAEALKDKEEYMYDHSIESQEDALDKEYENYEKFIDDSIEKLEQALDDLEKAFEKTTQTIEDNFNKMIDALNDGYVDGGGSGSSGGSAGGSGGGFGIANLNGQRGDAVSQAQQQLNSQYGAGLNVDGIWGSKTQKAYIRAVQTFLNNNHGAGLNVDGIWGSKTQSAWENAGYGARPFHKGVEEGFVGGLKGNEMFAKLLNGELVINQTQQDNFMDNILPELLSSSAEAIASYMNGGIDIEMNFNIEGNLDEEAVPKIEDATKQAVQVLFQRGRLRNVRQFST